VVTGQKAGRLGAGIERAVRVAERPDLSERVGKGQRLAGPADHLCEIGIVGGPIVVLSLGQSGNVPTRAAVFAAPDTGAVPFAAAARPKRAGVGISNHVIDRPAVAVRTPNGPAAALVTFGNQKRALGCADQKRHASRRHQIRALHPELRSGIYNRRGVEQCATAHWNLSGNSGVAFDWDEPSSEPSRRAHPLPALTLRSALLRASRRVEGGPVRSPSFETRPEPVIGPRKARA